MARPLGAKVLGPIDEPTHRPSQALSPRAARCGKPGLFSSSRHPEAAGCEGLRYPAPDVGAVPRCRGQEPSCRRRLLRHHSAGGVVLRRISGYRCRRSHQPRAGSLCPEQGARGGGAGVHLCRARLFRSIGLEELTIVPQHSQRPSRACLAGHPSGDGSDGPGIFSRAGVRYRGADVSTVRRVLSHRRWRAAGRPNLGSRHVRGSEAPG